MVGPPDEKKPGFPPSEPISREQTHVEEITNPSKTPPTKIPEISIRESSEVYLSSVFSSNVKQINHNFDVILNELKHFQDFEPKSVEEALDQFCSLYVTFVISGKIPVEKFLNLWGEIDKGLVSPERAYERINKLYELYSHFVEKGVTYSELSQRSTHILEITVKNIHSLEEKFSEAQHINEGFLVLKNFAALISSVSKLSEFFLQRRIILAAKDRIALLDEAMLHVQEKNVEAYESLKSAKINLEKWVYLQTHKLKEKGVEGFFIASSASLAIPRMTMGMLGYRLGEAASNLLHTVSSSLLFLTGLLSMAFSAYRLKKTSETEKKFKTRQQILEGAVIYKETAHGATIVYHDKIDKRLKALKASENAFIEHYRQEFEEKRQNWIHWRQSTSRDSNDEFKSLYESAQLNAVKEIPKEFIETLPKEVKESPFANANIDAAWFLYCFREQGFNVEAIENRIQKEYGIAEKPSFFNLHDMKHSGHLNRIEELLFDQFTIKKFEEFTLPSLVTEVNEIVLSSKRSTYIQDSKDLLGPSREVADLLLTTYARRTRTMGASVKDALRTLAAIKNKAEMKFITLAKIKAVVGIILALAVMTIAIGSIVAFPPTILFWVTLGLGISSFGILGLGIAFDFYHKPNLSKIVYSPKGTSSFFTDIQKSYLKWKKEKVLFDEHRKKSKSLFLHVKLEEFRKAIELFKQGKETQRAERIMRKLKISSLEDLESVLETLENHLKDTEKEEIAKLESRIQKIDDKIASLDKKIREYKIKLYEGAWMDYYALTRRFNRTKWDHVEKEDLMSGFPREILNIIQNQKFSDEDMQYIKENIGIDLNSINLEGIQQDNVQKIQETISEFIQQTSEQAKISMEESNLIAEE
ncbi:MAG: hypothetical protein Tsb0021_06080 [Chlamydiales bacterium]